MLTADISIAAADAQVLFHAMRLSSTSSPEISNACYSAVRLAIFLLEQHGQFSTNFLCAYAILAAYETAQGLYPAAFQSTGGLINLMCALGLHDKKKSAQVLKKPGREPAHEDSLWPWR